MTCFLNAHIPSDYLPIALQLLVALGFVVTVLGLTHLLGPKVHGKDKDDTFECGIEPEGNARQPFSVKYFLTAILFVLFDVEIIFLYPWAVNFKQLGWFGFIEIVLFMVLLLGGFFYVIRKGILNFNE